MAKLRSFLEFVGEKKSPYRKQTLLKYLRKWKDGEKIPVGIETSLKAQGMIPRADGEIRVSDEYKDTGDRIADMVKPKKKAIKESLQETLEDAEVTFTCSDNEGEPVEIREVDGTGMAGEPMVFAYIIHKGIITTREKVKPHLRPQDFKELCQYLDDVADNNEHSAMSFVK